MFIKKKWIDNALNSEVYFFLESVSSNHKIFSAKIFQKLCKNKKQIVKASRYDWFLHADVI